MAMPASRAAWRMVSSSRALTSLPLIVRVMTAIGNVLSARASVEA
jgi:hypothetical protein